MQSMRFMEREFFDHKGVKAGLYFFKDMAELRGSQEKLEDRVQNH